MPLDSKFHRIESDSWTCKCILFNWESKSHFSNLILFDTPLYKGNLIGLEDKTLDKHEYNHRNKDEDLQFVSKYEDYKSRYSVSRHKQIENEAKI